MEPENKKEIQLGWWRFVGLQAATIVILSSIFIFGGFYPKELETDYLALIQRKSADLKQVKAAADNVSTLKSFISKVDANETLSQEQLKKFDEKCEDIKDEAKKSNASWHMMQNAYQELSLSYLAKRDSLLAIKSLSGKLNSMSSSAQGSAQDFKDRGEKLHDQYTMLKQCVAGKCVDCSNLLLLPDPWK